MVITQWCFFCLFFFKQKTAYEMRISDWSSDVCSSDLVFENLELVLECQPALISSKIWNIDRLSPNGEIRIRDRTVPLAGALLSEHNEIGRASCRARVCQYV